MLGSAELFIAYRYIKARKKGFFAFLTTLIAIGGTTLGVCALVITLSVMTGFQQDIRTKILGIQPHIYLTRTDGVLFDNYKEVMDQNGMVDRVYLVGQLGMGITEFSSDVDDYNFSENGLYWGAGLGIEKANIIVELLYSVNYWEHNDDLAWNKGWSYTTRRIAVNVGYKFSF